MEGLYESLQIYISSKIADKKGFVLPRFLFNIYSEVKFKGAVNKTTGIKVNEIPTRKLSKKLKHITTNDGQNK